MRVDPLQILTKLAAVQNIPTRRVTPPFEGLEEFDYGLRRSLDPQFDWQEFGQLLLDSTPENTLLLVEGTFELHFALFRIPDEKNTVFLIGPWTVGPRTPSARKWVRRYLGEAGEAAVQEYYNGVKILEASDFYGALRVVVDTMFGCTVPVQELKEFLPFQFHPDTRYFHEPEFQKEIPVTMLEQRYESENRILDAVARGDEEAAIEAMHEVGIDITGEYPKPWTDEIVQAADVVITMGCGDACPIFPGKRYESWELDDPHGQDLDTVRRIRDELERRVRTLISSLQL